MEEIERGLGSLHLSAFPSAKIKADELFLLWLSSPEGSSAVLSVLDDYASGLVTASPSSLLGSLPDDVEGMESAPQVRSAASMLEPPRSPTKKSPKKRTQAEMQQQHTAATGSNDHYQHSQAEAQANTALTRRGHTPMNPGSGIFPDDEHGEEEKSAHTRRRANFDSIPAFYTPELRDRWRHTRHNPRRRERANSAGSVVMDAGSNPDSLERRRKDIEDFFRAYPNGVPLEKFVHATKRLCRLPSFFNAPLVRRINALYGPKDGMDWGRQGARVQLPAFLEYWNDEVAPYAPAERFFRVVKQPQNHFIIKDDFVPFLQELLHFHPGLDFLENHEEFQKKYALTVIVRIFYQCNTSRTGRLTLREVIHSDLFRAFMHVDEENDINRVREFFSYEHFYVLYCRFFELDADKDTKLSVEDVLRYSDHALSETIVGRIFQVGQRVFSDGNEGGYRRSGMAYPDFVYMMLAEEDKTSVTSLRYWFKCCDLDTDGVLTPEELNSFYKVQLARAVNLGQEPILFKDVLCQLVDLIDPEDPRAITFNDLIYPPEKRALSGILFDVLFNLQKFLKFETRDPFQEKLKKEDGFACDWDRFAAFEYQRLAQEDTVYDDMEVDADQMQHLQSQMDVGEMAMEYRFEEDYMTSHAGSFNGNGANADRRNDYEIEGDSLVEAAQASRGTSDSGRGGRRARRRGGDKAKESAPSTRSSARNAQISNRRK